MCLGALGGCSSGGCRERAGARARPLSHRIEGTSTRPRAPEDEDEDLGAREREGEVKVREGEGTCSPHVLAHLFEVDAMQMVHSRARVACHKETATPGVEERAGRVSIRLG